MSCVGASTSTGTGTGAGTGSGTSIYNGPTTQPVPVPVRHYNGPTTHTTATIRSSVNSHGGPIQAQRGRCAGGRRPRRRWRSRDGSASLQMGSPDGLSDRRPWNERAGQPRVQCRHRTPADWPQHSWVSAPAGTLNAATGRRTFCFSAGYGPWPRRGTIVGDFSRSTFSIYEAVKPAWNAGNWAP